MKTTVRTWRGGARRMNAIAKGGVFAAALALTAPSHANLVVNGGFDDAGTPVNVFATTNSIPGWYLGGAQAFERVYSPGCGAGGPTCGSGPILFLATAPMTSPAGGNFFAEDDDPTFGGSFGPDFD